MDNKAIIAFGFRIGLQELSGPRFRLSYLSPRFRHDNTNLVHNNSPYYVQTHPLIIVKSYQDFLDEVFDVFNFVLAESSSIALSQNIKVLSWLPQNDILGHSKTRLLIGHAGLNGMFESVYHGVPMLCSPFFGDQFDNAYAAKYAGFGQVLNLKDSTEEELVSVINNLLTDPR